MNAKKATMNVSRSRTFGLIVVGWVGMLVSVQAYALSLGGFQVTSALDEPLRAEITLQSVDSETLESLEVTLGSPEDFQRADVPRSEFLQQLRFSVSGQGDNVVVAITTEQPVKEPFLHFLISAEWSGGKLVREYTGLLDPPLYAEESPAPVQPATTGSGQADAAPATVAEPADSGVPQVATGTSAGRAAEYGPTREGDTLWEIASRLDTGAVRANVFQIMIALLRQNPDAFIDNNVNRLKTGQVLRLNDIGSLAGISAEEAGVVYAAQLDEWESFRTSVAGAEVQAPAETASAGTAADTAAADTDTADTVTETADTVTETETQMAADEQAAAADTGTEAAATGEEDDVLRIVQATVEDAEQSENATAGSDRAGEIAAMQGRIATLEETLESRNLENDELQERVRLLENQLENAQRLIEIESQELAAAQQRAAELQAEASANSVQSTQPVEPAGDSASQAVQGDSQASMAAETPQPSPENQSQNDTAASSGASEQNTQSGQQVAAVTAASQSSGQAAQNTQSSQQNSQQVRKVANRPPDGGAWWSQIPDMLFSSWMWMVGAGVGVLVLVLGLLMFLRRRQSIAEFEESILSGSALDSYSETTDTAASSASDTSFLSDFGTAGMGTMQADEVDPLAEAEVYLAYGRDEQAEDVLKEAARRDPERSEIKLKLLEIYKQRNDVKSFETTAEELYPAGDHGDVEVWHQVAAMGRELSPNNPLFQQDVGADAGPAGLDAAEDEPVTAQAAAEMDFDMDNLAASPARDEAPAAAEPEPEPDMPQATPRTTPDDDALDFGDDFIERSTRNVDPSTQPFPAPDQQTDLDRELDRLASERESPAAAATADAAAGAPGDGASNNISWDKADSEDSTLDFSARDTSELEFDLNLDESSIEQISGSEPETASGTDQDNVARLDSEEDAGGVLEFESENIPPEETWAGPSTDAAPTGDDAVSYTPAEEVASASAPAYNEAETKLDLARAYLDMGDKVGARSIIDEVMREGDPSQRDQAAELAAQL